MSGTPLKFRFHGGRPFANAGEEREILDLLCIALRQALTGSTKPGPGAILLERLGGGRSEAYVFRVTRSAGGGSGEADPKVLKIARLDAGSCERANYERFVRPLVPAEYRPDLIGFAAAHGRAALCYSCLGSSAKPETLTDRLAAGDLIAMNLLVPSLFEMLRQCWGGAAQLSTGASLTRYYLDRYFEDFDAAAAAESALFGHAAQSFGARRSGRGYRIGESLFPSICATLVAVGGARAYANAILHGDLNSDNIIVDRVRSSAHLIDFQRTGPGHVFQDFVTLEASLRINLPPDRPVGNIWETERLIAEGDPRIRSDSYAAAIADIRQTARRLFDGEESSANYRLAVVAVGLRLMRATDLSETALARITASALWAAKMLSLDN